MKKRTNKPICFMDFDGTIVDNKYRLYYFFQKNIDSKYSNSLTLEEFWSLKKMGVNELEWVNKQYSESYSLQLWNEKKLREIESEEYLKYEKIFEYSYNTLEKLRKNFHLVLITRRDNESGLWWELENFGIKDCFDDVHILNHGNVKKHELLMEQYDISENDIFVGDTEDDILSGVKMGVKTYLVESGIRSSWIVNKLGLEAKVETIKGINYLM